MAHPCEKEGFLGEVKEFMDSMKGFRTTIFTIALAIVVQVVAFVYMWGGITSTVNKNSDQIWCKLTPTAEKNQLNIERILTKLDNAKIVFASEKSEKSEKGVEGEQGSQGKNYDSIQK